MERYVPETITDQVKQGFSGPDANWFRGDSIDYVRRELLDPDARDLRVPRPGGRAAARRGPPRGPREPAPAALVAAELRALVPHVPQGRAPVRVLVTGASGFLGTPARAAAGANGTSVVGARAPARSTASRRVVADLGRGERDAARALDAVVHLAQSRRYREWPDGRGRRVRGQRRRARSGCSSTRAARRVALRPRLDRRRVRARRGPAARGRPARARAASTRAPSSPPRCSPTATRPCRHGDPAAVLHLRPRPGRAC